MTGKTLIKRTVTTLSKLPPDKVKEVSDFADPFPFTVLLGNDNGIHKA